MKNFKKLFLAIVLVTFTTNLVKSQDIVDYNNEVLYNYTMLDKQIAKFHTAIFDKDVSLDDLRKEYKMCQKICKYQGKYLRNIKQHPKDKYFLPSVIAFYTTVESTLNSEYSKIMDYYNKTWEESFAQKITDLANKAADKIIKGENFVIDSQQKFANENDLRLEN